MNMIKQQIPAQPASDGAGVKIQRVHPHGLYEIMDPFLMLDEIRSDNASDYIAGFPPHPHRGFETITYMRKGTLEHEDHMGNKGLVNSGGAQWMTAGKGVIHSEQPHAEDGTFHGFQLWLNLPAKEKMRDAEYHDLQAADIPSTQAGAHRINILAGQFEHQGQTLTGPIKDRQTLPQLWDIELTGTEPLALNLASELNILIYVYEGEASVNGELLGLRKLTQLNSASGLSLSTGDSAKLLLIGGKPLAEPVVQHGPFVMNTQQQIQQAIRDYSEGTLTQ